MLSLYNSLTRSVEPFEPKDPPKVSVYTCGPTVYGHVHIGNWSTFLSADVLVRWLRESGYEVTYVQNITDVEDKIIRESQKAGMNRASFTAQWTEAFLEGMQRLDCHAQVDHFPYATDHVDGMAVMIQALLERKHAYIADDGSIYYRVSSFETYGQLAHLDPATLKAGASGRVAADEYEKDEVADFALWKAYNAEDGDVFWEPTYTVDGEARVIKGRPGWHIECSVMASALLGDQIDIHMGGEDLLFPHHQNEIAQSEGATGLAPFVRMWMHRKHLRVGGTKMSRSLKNFHTLKDVEEQGGEGSGRAYRYLVVTSHYRHSLDFTWDELERAKRTLKGLDEDRDRFQRIATDAAASAFATPFEARFTAAMNDDLGVSQAIAALYDAIREANRGAQQETLTPQDAASVLALIDKADRVLGLGFDDGTLVLNEAQQALVDARAEARRTKDWAESDRLRDVLADEHSLTIKDGKDGQEVRPL